MFLYFQYFHASVVSLEDKKVIAIANSFQKVVDLSNCKPSKIWVDKGSKCYNR